MRRLAANGRLPHFARPWVRWKRPTHFGRELEAPHFSTTLQGCIIEAYGIEFGHEHYERMAEQLAGVRGRFIMSINETPFIRRTFALFQVDEVKTTWMVGTKAAGAGKPVTELIISNPR